MQIGLSRRILLLLVAICAVGSLALLAGTARADKLTLSRLRSLDIPTHRLCSPPTATRASCLAITVPKLSSLPRVSAKLRAMDVAPRFLGSGVDGGLAPADLRSAYDLSGQGGTGTIAIVDPFGDPTAEADLSVYRAHYGLPPCTSANGCFRKLDQRGGSAFPPIAPDGEAGENALDLDMASAMCPRCRQAGMMTTVVAGSVGFIVGVFLGITIAKA